jgi:hypothetical protein
MALFEIQLDLFEGKLTEVELLRRELEVTRQELTNTRRGLFARYDELGKMILELRQAIKIN